MNKCVIALLGGLMSLGPVSAQVVTPPTPAPAKTPEFVPPPQPPAQPPATTGGRPPDGRPIKPLPSKVTIPKVDYKPLGEKGADGKLLPLPNTPQRLSLLEVHNPFIKDEDRARFSDYLAKRDQRMEQVAVDNLDLVEKVEAGELDRFDFVDSSSQRQAFTNARALTDPINPFGDLISDMARRELLTGVQGAMADKLCKEYQAALREESRPEGAKRVDATWMAKFTYNNKAHEALLAVGRARAMAVAKAAEVLPGSGLDSALVSKLIDGCKGAPSSDAGRAAVFTALGKDLSVEQRRAWLRAALATRPALSGEPLVPFPKTAGRRPAGEDPNAEPTPEPEPTQTEPAPVDPAIDSTEPE